MARPVWSISLLLFIVLQGLGSAAATEGDPKSLTISLEQDRLTVHAKEVPHWRLLEELAKRLQFELIIAGPLEDRRSLEIEARPWEEALKKALSPASWAFVYDSAAGEPKLAKVFVFPSKDNPSMPARPTPSSTRVVAPVPVPMPAHPPQGGNTPQLAEPGADPPMAELLEADDEETRALAVVGLATMGGEEAIAALKRALQDKQPWIRETAVEALADLGGDQAIQGLQQALRDDHEEVRKAAQEALIRLQPNPQ
jgi:hypothetical protein